jgi:tetratricopeptide (TPR) repeat protein
MIKLKYTFYFLLVVLVFSSCSSSKKATSDSFRGFTMYQPKAEKQIIFEQTLVEAIKAEQVENNTDKAIRRYEKCLSLNDKSAVVMYKLGNLYLENKRVQEASDLLEKATKLQPENFYYKESLIEAYKKQNRPGKIIKVYEDLIEQNPNKLVYYFEMANVYMVMREPDKALKIFENLEKERGYIPQFSRAKIRIYGAINDFEKAEAEAKKLIASDPYNKEYYGILIDLYLSFGKEDMVARIYEDILTFDPEDGKAQLVLADYYFRRNNFEKSEEYSWLAIQNLTLDVDSKISFLLINYASYGVSENGDVLFEFADALVRVHPDEAKPYAFRADLLARTGKYDLAHIDYKKALDFDKDNLIIWNKVIGYYTEKRNFEKAIETVDEALNYFPSSPELYYFKGISLSQLKEYKKAASTMEEGLIYLVDNKNLEFEYYSNLGEIYNSLKEYAKSDKYYDKALKLKPNDPFILNNYAYYLSLRNEKLDKALEMSDKSLKMEPKSPSYLDTYGWILFLKGDLEGAIEYLEKAVELKPYDADILEHLGDAFYKNGQKDEAIKKWEKAIKKGGDKERLEKKISDGI